MNKKIILALVVVVLAIGGGVFALSKTRDKTINNQTEVSTEGQDTVIKTDSESEAMAKTEDEVMKKDDAMIKSGSYVTQADYNKDPAKYSDSKKVYFFHASWCPICQSINKEIERDASKIPTGVTLIKTDFDSSTDLRKKYGVTTQYTFVQFDNQGNETAQWSATSLDEVISGIK